MTLENIYPLFILIGCTIGVILAYLWRHARSAANINLQLIQLNEQLQFDTPFFLQNAWPLLSKGGVQGIHWQLDWFGIPMTFQAGATNGYNLHKTITVGEMNLQISFQQYRHSERRYFNSALIETFLLLLRTDMWIKAGATDATFAQVSKLTLFLEHDMKNIAQFIQLMSDQLSALPAGKEQQVLDYLRSSAPLIRHRADRIVNTLTAGKFDQEPLRPIAIAAVIAQICALYRLDYQINGAADVVIQGHTLDSAFDNILKNYSDIAARQPGLTPLIHITISENLDSAVITINASNVPSVKDIERLFEPFWSRDPAGLGIGLYQAKQVIESCQGNIQAQLIEATTLQFIIELPRTAQISATCK